LKNIETLCIEGGMGVSAHAKNIETLCMEGAMGVSAHTSNRYSNAPPSITLKLSAWNKVWVLVHVHQIDITLNPLAPNRHEC